MLNLLLELEGTRHKYLLLKHLVRLKERSPECFLVTRFENLVSLDETRPFDVHRAADFAHAHVASRVVLHQLGFLSEFKVLYDGVESIVLPVLHVVREHLNDFGKIKLSCPAELK